MHNFPKTIYAIQHLAFEDLGALEDIFYQKGYRIRYVEAGVDDLRTALQYDGLTIILGGPIGVNDVADYPFLCDEIELLKTRLQARQPTLGICLGAQLMAKALGAEVYAGPTKEIGWSTLMLSETNHSILAPLANTHVLHWHGDTFDLPEHTIHLAASNQYTNQAFQYGKSLGLQFHLEVDAEHLEKWLIGHHTELKQAQINIQQLRQDNQTYALPLMVKAREVILNYMHYLKM